MANRESKPIAGTGGTDRKSWVPFLLLPTELKGRKKKV